MIFKNSVLTITSIIVLIFCSTTSFAQYFWVGGTGDWDDFSTHWATTSGGSNFHSSVPSANDDVFFDSNSFTAIGQVVSYNSTNNFCNTFDCSGTLYLPLFQMPTGYNLQINGSLNVSNEASYNFATITMVSSSTGNTINTNGESLGSASTLEINGTGEFSLSGEINMKYLHILQGTFNTDDHPIYTDFNVEILGDLSKNVNLGSSEIDCAIWNTGGSNNTINAGNSIINAIQMNADIDDSGPYDYATLKFKESGFNLGTLSGSGNFESIDATLLREFPLKFSAGSIIGVDEILTSEDIHNPTTIELSNNSDTEFATFVKSSGSLNLSYVEMQSIHATGGASFNLNPGIDRGNNDGWNITEITPTNYFWINNAGEYADITHWSSTSGGSNNMTDYPSRYDNVFFDINSFSLPNQEVLSTSSSVVNANNINWSSDVNSPIFNAQYADIYGDFILSDAVIMDINFLVMLNQGTATLRTSSQGSLESISTFGSGILNIDSDINAEVFRVNEGTLNTNDFDINLSNGMIIWFGNDKIVNLGSSEINTSIFTVSCTGCEINAQDAIISVQEEFRGGQENFYNHLIIDGPTVTFHNNTFNTLEFMPGSSPVIYNNSELTINDELILDGTPSQPINISSNVVGTPFSFIKSSGIVNGTYLVLQDNSASGGATFNALQSIDNGGNTGWNIEALEPLDYYWVGNGGNWTDNENHWATTSGGSTFHNFPPGTLDQVYFDANSFSSNNQEVTIDQDNIYCSDLNWTGVTNNPSFEGEDKTINSYGSLIFSENMSVNIGEVFFNGIGTYDIDTGFDDSPGINTSFTFSDEGTWNILHPLKLNNFNLDAGTINTNGNDINCQLTFVLRTDLYKEINLGTSTVSTRIFGYQFGTNGVINGSNSDIHIYQYINPLPYNGGLGTEVLNLNNVLMGNSTEVNTTTLVKEFLGSFELNELTFEPGVEVSVESGEVITVNQLIAEGTSSEHIILGSSIVGSQGTIHQDGGTVDGQYLELQDAEATGSATFYANNSIDIGNVSGWIFTNIQQSINFPVIDDVLEDVGTITLDASASSGLLVNYVIDFGPATLNDNVLTITGPGQIQITASQDGNNEYAAAASQTNVFCSTPIAPIITNEDFEDYVTLSANDSQLCIWYRNGIEIDNTPTATIDVILTGIYSALRTTVNCDSEFSNEINISVISVEEMNGQSSLFFYPNPAKEKITIVLPENGAFEYKVFDVSGKLIMQDIDTDFKNKNLVLDISSLDKSIYFLVMTTEKGNYSSTFIKE